MKNSKIRNRRTRMMKMCRVLAIGLGIVLSAAIIVLAVSASIKTPEEQIREAAHQAQMAVEAFAADTDGRCPADWEDVSGTGVEFQDYLDLFGGMPENPHETGSDAIVFDAVPRPGEVAIEVTGKWNEKYAVRYADRDGKVFLYISK